MSQTVWPSGTINGPSKTPINSPQISFDRKIVPMCSVYPSGGAGSEGQWSGPVSLSRGGVVDVKELLCLWKRPDDPIPLRFGNMRLYVDPGCIPLVVTHELYSLNL